MELLKRTTALLVATLVLGTAACTKSSSDAEITGRVKTAISSEPSLKGTRVSVSTKEKVVHLSGTVESRGERAMLIAVARKVEGVKGLKTDLLVKPQQKTVVTPQQKRRVEARAKREPRAQPRVMPSNAENPRY